MRLLAIQIALATGQDDIARDLAQVDLAQAQAQAQAIAAQQLPSPQAPAAARAARVRANEQVHMSKYDPRHARMVALAKRYQQQLFL